MNYGEVQAINPVRIATIYEDSKIRIQGTLDKAHERYQYFTIYLKMIPNDKVPRGVIEKSNTFGIPRTPNIEETLVFDSRISYDSQNNGFTTHVYIRPGRWLAYIQLLMDRLDKDADQEQRLNKTLIDDTDLFPDLEYPIHK